MRIARKRLLKVNPFLFQNLIGYNEKTDIYSLGIAACEAANGFVPFSDVSNTLMLLEKFRGARPKLFDSTTFTDDQQPGEGANMQGK